MNRHDDGRCVTDGVLDSCRVDAVRRGVDVREAHRAAGLQRSVQRRDERERRRDDLGPGGKLECLQGRDERDGAVADRDRVPGAGQLDERLLERGDLGALRQVPRAQDLEHLGLFVGPDLHP